MLPNIKTALLFIPVLFSMVTTAQSNRVQGTIFTRDTVDLKILNMYPETFPNVSVIFKAENRNGDPVWNLTRENTLVKENAQNCEVISVEHISENKPINLSIVIDHSGSMGKDYSFVQVNQIVLPQDYISPIDKAKSAVKNFINSFNTRKDYVSITGFSSYVDISLPLTQDINRIRSMVDSMKANSSTALYDAMLTGIGQIKWASGLNVVIVFTDGMDNASSVGSHDVISQAIREKIPVYIIGLGSVNVPVLQQIADSTHGHFYYTRTAASLDTVYADISKHIQAFYELVYRSENLTVDTARQVELSFNIDSLFIITNPETMVIPSAVIERIADKEKEKQYLIKGEVFILAVLALGTLVFYYQRKKKSKNQPVIKNVYPNPTNGILNVDFQSGEGQLQILNLNGQILRTFDISGETIEADLSDFESGHYISIIQANGQISKAIEFVIQK